MLWRSDTLFKGSLVMITIMIFGMIVIGGITRLTGSGLSIVEWKPITGVFPPFTSVEWNLEFSKYQQSPEFQKLNFTMTLQDFKSIFWLEYIHRLWGRLIGIVLCIPTFLMLFKKQHRALWPLLSLLWLLGLAQGAMGWWMVKSGLSYDAHVSPYRLSAHLFLGFAVFGASLWMAFSLYKDQLCLPRVGFSEKTFQSLKRLSYIAFILVLLTAFLGALVAGLKAGLMYNTFPLMGDSIIPHELLTLSPWWKDLLENPVSVQFLHRIMAILTVLYCVILGFYQRNLHIPLRLSYGFAAVRIAALLQFSLGILTLLFVVPVTLGVLHQAFAFILFGSLVYVVFLIYTR